MKSIWDRDWILEAYGYILVAVVFTSAAIFFTALAWMAVTLVQMWW
jgi:hypothetical protein